MTNPYLSSSPVAALNETEPACPCSLLALRAGDPDAIASCYRAHAQTLVAVAYRLTASAEDAQDIVHDVFVGLPEALAHYEERGQLRAWLVRVTTRVALMHRRKELRRDASTLESVLENSGRDSVSSDRDPIAHDRAMAALARLSPTLRHVFVLRVIDGYSHTEIAALLDISINNSEVRLHRAVQQLRRMLGGIV